MKPALRLRNKIGIIGITICIALLVVTTNVLGTSTSYLLAGGGSGTGTFTLNGPISTATSFESWALVFFDNFAFNSNTDTFSESRSSASDIELFTVIDSPLFSELLNFRVQRGDDQNYEGIISFSGTALQFDISGGTELVTAPIPEPTTLLLMSTGLLGLAGYRWHHRRREGTQVA